LSPIAEDGLNVDLISKLGLPVIIVVNDELGAINQALLTINAAEQRRIKIMCVILNQITEERETSLNNKSELQEFTRHPLLKYNENGIEPFIDQLKKLINNS
jgi:dethiobiotin synthetase